MKNYQLEPTFDNICSSIVNNYINRNEYLFRFYELLNAINTSTSISLDGAWGTGKTFFVKQTEILLKSEFPNIDELKEKAIGTLELKKLKLLNELLVEYKNKRNLKTAPQYAIYYDAWKNDNSSDPILSLIYEIVKSFHNMNKFQAKPEILTGIKEIFQKIVSSVNLKINLTTKTIMPQSNLPVEVSNTEQEQPGVNLEVNGEKIASIFDSFDKFKKPNLLEDLKKEDDLHELINIFFDTLSLEKGSRLVIFIDELDRCKPTYAVKFLERIKHYFNRQNITFVFSTNIKELKNTVKNYYGNYFDADRYLDKFFDLRLQLPQIDVKTYLKFLQVTDKDDYKQDIILQVIQYFHLEMREISRFIKIYEIATSNEPLFAFPDPIHEITKNMCKEFILPFLIGIYMTDSNSYKNVIDGNGKDIFLDYFKTFPNSRFFKLYEIEDTNKYCSEDLMELKI